MRIKPKDQSGSSSLPELSIQLDWRAYFKAFCGRHGEPVEHGGRLLFPDGWAYSSSDYKGPEWPPPDDLDQFRALKLSYWRVRLEEVERQERELRALLDQLEALQRAKSTPLQRSVRRLDEAGKGHQEAEPIDYPTLLMRLEWLSEDKARCVKEIEDAQPAVSDDIGKFGACVRPAG